MKKRTFAALFLGLGIAVAACQKNNSTVTPASPNIPLHHNAKRGSAPSDTVSSFITIATANNMINSYLASINSSTNDSDVRSFTINADSLRAYLSSTAVKNIKLIFAHTADYVNSGNYGVNAGYQAGSMTIIVAAYDASGNYVYHNGMVLDHCVPCPYTCPPGNASSYTLD
jgi:hypothetical protein